MTTEVTKPDAGAVEDKNRLLEVLVRFYDRIRELGSSLLPSQVPALKAITCASLAALRQTVGAADGELGPRLVLLVGGSKVLDGSQALYAWSSTSTAADNNTSVICPAKVGTSKPGRWLRFSSLAGFTDAGITQLTGDVTAGPGSGSQAATVAAALKTGRLLRAPQVLTSGTSITHPTGVATIVVEVIGGGGGGGGAVNSTASQVTLGAGGGSGAYASKSYVAVGASSTYAIGAAGTAGANTGAAAGAGGSTTFTHNGVTVTSPGGNGAPANTGSGMAGASGTAFAASGPGTGGAVATNGDLNQGGTDGGFGVRFSGTTGQSGGGAGIYGGGGPGRTTQGAGNAATGRGAGGGGGLSTNAGGAVTGGAGGGGVIVVWEYS